MKGIIIYRISFLLLIFAVNSFAATRTWTGATSTSWADASNWGGVAPGNNDDVNIPTVVSGRYPIISSAVSIGNGTINVNSNNGAGASLTLIAGGSLTTTGLITVRANGTFLVTGGTATIDGISNSGLLDVQGGTITSTTNITINTGSTFTQSGGLVHMASSTVTNPTDNLVISGGTVTQSGGTFYTRDYGPTTGTFNQTGSTAVLRIFRNWTPSSAHTFNSTSGTVRYSGASGSGATFTSTNSQFNNMIIDASIDPGFDSDANSNIKISGDLTNNNSALSNGTKAVFIFNSSNTQTITSSAENFFANLTIDKPGGYVSLATGLSITNILTMVSGNISTGPNLLTLGTSIMSRGTLTYTSGMIITGDLGGFRRWFTNAIASNILFPVGTSLNNNSATISYTSAPTTGGTLTTKFIESDPGTFSSALIDDAGYTIDRYSSAGYWQIDIANGLTGGTYSLSLKGQGFNTTGLEITNYPLLRILKRTDPDNDWTVQGAQVNATGSNLNPLIQRSGLSGFSQFAMGGNAADGNPLQGSLPVELSLFTYSVNSNSVELNWITESEKNNMGFEIYRKNSKSDWLKIGFVEGSGNSNSQKTYLFNDNNLNSNTYNYRLKQMDYNGNFEYFNLQSDVVVGTPGKFNMNQNFPNPFNPVTKISYELPVDADVLLKVYDISGREIANLVNEKQKPGYYTVGFNGQNLSSGIYFYTLRAGNLSATKKMLLIK